MSHNQSRAGRSEAQLRKPGRPGSASQQRASGGGGGKGGGGGATAPVPPLSASSSAASRSSKKSSNGQGGHYRTGQVSSHSESNVVVAAATAVRVVPNGLPSQSQSHEVPVPSATKPIESPIPKISKDIPKAPSVHSNSGAPVPGAPGTPSKGDGSKGFSLQFGSLSPGLMNGMQIPARTASAPPNLDEQKRDQACHYSSKVTLPPQMPSAPKPQKKDVSSVDQPNIKESRPSQQVKADVKLKIPAGPFATAQKLSTAIAGMSMPLPYQQPQISFQFGVPSGQMQSQGFTAGSLQMPVPLPVGNNTQVPHQVFIQGLQSHPLQSQGMMHHGQSFGFAPQMGHQLGNLGIGMNQQFTPQQAGKFGCPRRTVKITHPDTHEELKLNNERTDVHSDVSYSGSRPHPNVPPPAQPIQSVPPAHPVTYYSAIQTNTYNPSRYFQNPTSLPLTSTHMSSGFSAFTYPVSQGGPHVSSVNPSALNSLPASKGGPPTQSVVEPASLGHSHGGNVVSSAPSALAYTKGKPAVVTFADKIVTSATGSSSPANDETLATASQSVSESETSKSLEKHCQAINSTHQLDNRNGFDGFPEQLNSVAKSPNSVTMPVAVEYPPLPSVPATTVEESVALVTTAGDQKGELTRGSKLLNSDKRPSGKEMQLSDKEHQADSADHASILQSLACKSAGQVFVSPENVQTTLELGEESTIICSLAPSNLDLDNSKFLESEVGKTMTSLRGSFKIPLQVATEVSHGAHADVFPVPADTTLDQNEASYELSNASLEADGLSSEKLDGSLYKKQGVCAFPVVRSKQKSSVTAGDRNAGVPNEFLQDHCNSDECSDSFVPESVQCEKHTEAVLQTGENSDKNVEEVNAVCKFDHAETKLVFTNPAVDCKVGTTDDKFGISSTPLSIGGTASSSSSAASLDGEPSAAAASKIEGEKGIAGQEVAMTGMPVMNAETATALAYALSEMALTDEVKGTGNTAEDQASTSSLGYKDKISIEQNKVKTITGKKKKMKDILMKADAAGITSDLYIAYKGPEETHETAVSSDASEIINSSGVKHEEVNVAQDSLADNDDGLNKSELDDWEDAAELTSENELPVHRATGHHEENEGGVRGRKKYSRDFLLSLSVKCGDLPAGFKSGPDIVDVLKIGLVTSHLTSHDSHTSPGRFMDRPTGVRNSDWRGSGIVDDDKWVKISNPVALVWDPGMDVTPGSVSANFRPGQGNHGVLRNPRGQSSGQFIGGIHSGPMQTLASLGGMPRTNADSDCWQRASYIQKGLFPVPQTPSQSMHKAEKKYEVGNKVFDEEQAKQRKIKGILNKLTPQNFDKLFEQVKEVNIDSAVILTAVISQIFDKALTEPTFCEMYADFCVCLAGALPDFYEDNEKVTFKRSLLNKCQEEFERGEREQAEASEGEIEQSKVEREEKKVKARRRMLGNIRLIGELYKKKMLTEKIMHECIKKLLGQNQCSDEEDIEALCKLMSTIGERIDHPNAREPMDAYFDMMFQLSNNQKLSSRVRFMLKDAIDLRKNNWQQRRKVEGPKKIEEVHRDAAQERHLQSSRLSRAGSGIGSSRRGQPIDYSPSPRGSSVFSSIAPQMSVPRTLPPQFRGYGIQDIRSDDRHSLESRILSVPLTQRPIDDDSITLGPQGRLGRGISIRGNPLISSSPAADASIVNGDLRRISLGPNGHIWPSGWSANVTEEPVPRFMSDRFAESTFCDRSNTLEGNTSFGSKDSRNTDPTFNRPIAAPVASGHMQGSLTGMNSLRSEPKFSEDHLRKKSILAIREYYSARNEDEIRLCIKELNCPRFYPVMVMLWVTDSFERKNDDRDLLARLLVNLSKSPESMVSQLQLIKGFEAVLCTLEDTVTDSPKAAEYLGRILGIVISENVVPLSEVGRIIREGGEEPGCLVERGLASEVLVNIFELIKQYRGDTTLKNIREHSNLRLEDFQPRDPIKSRKLDAFM